MKPFNTEDGIRYATFLYFIISRNFFLCFFYLARFLLKFICCLMGVLLYLGNGVFVADFEVLCGFDCDNLLIICLPVEFF